MDRRRLNYLRGVQDALAVFGFKCRPFYHDKDIDYDFDRFGLDFDHKTRGKGCWHWILTFDTERELWHLTVLWKREDGSHDVPQWESRPDSLKNTLNQMVLDNSSSHK